jgi:hypothetical protein
MTVWGGVEDFQPSVCCLHAGVAPALTLPWPDILGTVSGSVP